MSHITCEQAVRKLKEIGLSSTARCVAFRLDTDARAVATALRLAVKDGRVTIHFKKGVGFYRFVRLTAKTKVAP